MSVFLNTVTGHRELEECQINKAITALAIKLVKIRPMISNSFEPGIELTIILPGTTHKPAFQGMRLNGYSVNDNMLYIESAIPDTMLHSEHANEYMLALLQDAIDNGADFFTEKGLSFPRQQWLSAL